MPEMLVTPKIDSMPIDLLDVRHERADDYASGRAPSRPSTTTRNIVNHLADPWCMRLSNGRKLGMRSSPASARG